MRRKNKMREKFILKLKKCLVLGMCLCMFQTTVSAATPWSQSNGIFYDGNGNEIKGAIAKGIDVSYHQGDIDWAKVKAEGFTFALLRCGYGDNIEFQHDSKFVQNVKGCEENGIEYGVYIYSYAVNTQMAKNEADHVLTMLEAADAKPTMPIYYDIEDEKTQGNLKASKLGDIAETFCSIIRDKGYKVGVYSNYYWWTNKLTDARFENWARWVARYNNESGYDKKYDIWQYSETSTVNGIGGNKTDVNILLSRECSVTGHNYAVEQLITKGTISKSGKATYYCKTCGHKKTDIIPKIKSITLSKTKYEYSGKLNKPTVKITNSKGSLLTKNDFSVSYKKNKNVGTATVTITLKGNYQGTTNKTFKIVPGAVKKLTVKNNSRQKAKVNWKKVSQASGFEIQYATNKSMKKAKTVTVKKTSKALSKLKKNKTYYIRVRAYKTVSGNKLYGSYSGKKSVKIKK